MLLESIVRFRRAKTSETLSVMFAAWMRKHDLPVPKRRSEDLDPSYQEMAELARGHAKGLSEKAAIRWFNSYFVALAAAHRLTEITTGKTLDFVIDRLVIGRDADAAWIVEAREIAFREAFNQFEM